LRCRDHTSRFKFLLRATLLRHASRPGMPVGLAARRRHASTSESAAGRDWPGGHGTRTVIRRRSRRRAASSSSSSESPPRLRPRVSRLPLPGLSGSPSFSHLRALPRPAGRRCKVTRDGPLKVRSYNGSYISYKSQSRVSVSQSCFSVQASCCSGPSDKVSHRFSTLYNDGETSEGRYGRCSVNTVHDKIFRTSSRIVL
jgi:hypothetical protein